MIEAHQVLRRIIPSGELTHALRYYPLDEISIVAWQAAEEIEALREKIEELTKRLHDLSHARGAV